MRFVVMLRSPVDRALSSYWFRRSHLFSETGGDEGSIEEFLVLAKQEMQDRHIYEQCMSRHMTAASPRYRAFDTALTTLNGSHSTPPHHLSFHIDREYKRANLYVSNNNNNGDINDIADSGHISHQTAATSDDMDETLLYHSLVECYGASLRSPTLGHRHLDKGVYVDQIARWLDAGFRREQFLFVGLSDLQNAPQETFQKVLDFMQVLPTRRSGTLLEDSHSGGDGTDSIDNTERIKQRIMEQHHNTQRGHLKHDAVIDLIDFNRHILSRPNALSGLERNRLGAEDRQMLEAFYGPHNEMLFELLGTRYVF
eukprot:gene28606-35491_t